MESCESLVEDPDPLIASQEIQTVFRDFLPTNLLPNGLLEACITCLQQYVQSKVQGSNSLSGSGVFWVNMGLLQIKVWTPQTIFDPAVKRAYKLNYAQQEVSFMMLIFHYIQIKDPMNYLNTELSKFSAAMINNIAACSHAAFYPGC